MKENIILGLIALVGLVIVMTLAHLVGWELDDVAAASVVLGMLFAALKWVAKWAASRKEREAKIQNLELEHSVNSAAQDLLGQFLGEVKQISGALLAFKVDRNEGNLLRLETTVMASGKSIGETQKMLGDRNSNIMEEIRGIKAEME